LHTLPLGLAGLALGIFIWLAWHFGCRKENFTVDHQPHSPIPVPKKTGRRKQTCADLRSTICKTGRRVLVEALTLPGLVFLDEGGDAPTGTLVLSRGDYQQLVRRAFEVGLLIDINHEGRKNPVIPEYLTYRDVHHSAIKTRDIIALEKMFNLPAKGA
jgi:hypothetical protein